MSEEKRIPVFERRAASGAVRERVSGVNGTPQAGDRAGPTVTWNLRAAPLAGLRPRPGDRYRDAAGVSWAITKVEALADGAYPCACSREV